MLIKHTIEEVDAVIRFYQQAECVCDRCHKRFTLASISQLDLPSEDAQEKFKKGDFSLCNDCQLIIDKIKARQMTICQEEGKI